MRQIDADALKTDVRRYVLEGTDEFGTISVEVAERSFLRLIDRQPTIEAEPVRQGRWIIQRYYGGMRKGMVARVVCSECFGPAEETNYCPDCGAKMDGVAAGETEPSTESMVAAPAPRWSDVCGAYLGEGFKVGGGADNG